MDWRAADKIRMVQGKRRAVAVLDTQISETERDLEMALSFEAEYTARLNAIQHQIGRIATGYDLHIGMVKEPGGTQAEYDLLVAERSAIETERDRAIAEKTTTSADAAGFRVSYCPLMATGVQKRLHGLRTAREMKAHELADLEGTLSPGLMCASGIEAPDLAEHRERVAAARAAAGVSG